MPVFGIFPSSGGGNTLKSIAISTPPTKTSYTAGDQFDPAGMVLEATYEDDSVAQVTGFYFNPAGELTADVNQITVLYSEGGVLLSAVQPISVSNAVGIALPSQIGTLTYTGECLVPEWSNLDATKMYIGGMTSGVNAGTYYITVCPRLHYTWMDGTTDLVMIPWTIGKAAGSASLSETSVTLTTQQPTAEIEVSRSGDGVITAVSSNVASVTASVNGNIVTITSVGTLNGTVDVTISVSDGTNHTAVNDLVCSAVVNCGVIVSLTPVQGPYTRDFISQSYATINKVAKAISNSSFVTNRTYTVYVDDGSNHFEISVGDSFRQSLYYGMETSVDIPFYIAGFNHDDLTDPFSYGELTETGKVGISFVGDPYGNPFEIGNSGNVVGYKTAPIRDTLDRLETYTKAKSTNLLSKAKKMNKPCISYEQGEIMEFISGGFNIPSATELCGVSTVYPTEGEQYAYFASGNSPTKGIYRDVWTRTARRESLNYFYAYVSSGYLTYESVNSDNYLDIIFGI